MQICFCPGILYTRRNRPLHRRSGSHFHSIHFLRAWHLSHFTGGLGTCHVRVLCYVPHAREKCLSSKQKRMCPCESQAQHSHIWVIFIFHKNNNHDKLMKARLASVQLHCFYAFMSTVEYLCLLFQFWSGIIDLYRRGSTRLLYSSGTRRLLLHTQTHTHDQLMLAPC